LGSIPVLANPAGSANFAPVCFGWGKRMNFQRILLLIVVLLAAGLAGSF
jgi:hypothetical protein